jgi:hypothetical protein
MIACRNLTIVSILALMSACSSKPDSSSLADRLKPSDKLSGKVVDVSCGEVNPFVIGDICVILLEDERLTLTAILADYDDFIDFDNIADDSRLIGQKAQVKNSCLGALTSEDKQVITENYSWGDRKINFKHLKKSECFSASKP